MISYDQSRSESTSDSESELAIDSEKYFELGKHEDREKVIHPSSGFEWVSAGLNFSSNSWMSFFLFSLEKIALKNERKSMLRL